MEYNRYKTIKIPNSWGQYIEKPVDFTIIIKYQISCPINLN